MKTLALLRRAIVDTGPLVAYIDRHEARHAWAVDAAGTLALPWRTCEAVLAEGWHLLRRVPGGQDALLAMLEDDLLTVDLSLAAEISAVRAMCHQYRDVPMSLADACLVRLAETFDDDVVFTLDAHFRIYQKHRRQPLTVLMPEL